MYDSPTSRFLSIGSEAVELQQAKQIAGMDEGFYLFCILALFVAIQINKFNTTEAFFLTIVCQKKTRAFCKHVKLNWTLFPSVLQSRYCIYNCDVIVA